MTYRRVTTLQRFLGTAAERAAMTTTGINPGSTYFESDTGLLYVLDNAGSWQAKKESLAALPAGTALLGKVGIDQTTPGTTNAIAVTASVLRETQIGADLTAAFANLDAANTQKVIADIAKPTTPVSEYELVVYNPSTETDLTVKILCKELALGGGDRYALLTSVSIPKAQALTGTTVVAHVRLLHGIFNGSATQIIVSNDTAVGAAGAFTTTMRLREVA